MNEKAIPHEAEAEINRMKGELRERIDKDVLDEILAIDRLRKKIRNQRQELRRLNRKLRAIYDGIKYARATPIALQLDDQRDLDEVDRRELIAKEAGV